MIIYPCLCCEQERLIRARGLCSACYQRARYSGTLADYARAKWPFETALAHAKANETDEGCWPWPVIGPNGYPRAARSFSRAYLATYTQVYGPVPDGLTLDHICHSMNPCSGGNGCRHRRCVRPDHLEPVTAREQQARRSSRRSLACRRGHPWTATNTKWVLQRGKYPTRVCRECHAEDQRLYTRRRAERSSSSA